MNCSPLKNAWIVALRGGPRPGSGATIPFIPGPIAIAPENLAFVAAQTERRDPQACYNHRP